MLGQFNYCSSVVHIIEVFRPSVHTSCFFLIPSISVIFISFHLYLFFLDFLESDSCITQHVKLEVLIKPSDSLLENQFSPLKCRYIYFYWIYKQDSLQCCQFYVTVLQRLKESFPCENYFLLNLKLENRCFKVIKCACLRLQKVIEGITTLYLYDY